MKKSNTLKIDSDLLCEPLITRYEHFGFLHIKKFKNGQKYTCVQGGKTDHKNAKTSHIAV